MSRFGDGGHARCSMGPKGSLEMVFFSLKSPCLRASGIFLASDITQMAVISGLYGSYGSMGPEGHVRCLDLVIGGMPSAQWVQNSRWMWSFLT